MAELFDQDWPPKDYDAEDYGDIDAEMMAELFDQEWPPKDYDVEAAMEAHPHVQVISNYPLGKCHMCKLCDWESFLTATEMNGHIQKCDHTFQQMYKCDSCARKFSSVDALRKHYITRRDSV